LACGCSDSGTAGRAGSGAYGCALASADKTADQGSACGASANLRDVTGGVAFALAAHAAAVNRLAVGGDEANRDLAPILPTSAGVHVGYFAFHRIAGLGNDLAMGADVAGQNTGPNLFFVGGA